MKGFKVKCRDPRCSIECYQNAAQKDAAIVARHLRDLPEEMVAYRGNLTLPSGATPEDHRRVKKAFLRSMNRWKTRKNYTVEIMARTHLTDATKAHYDILVFTDAPHKPFHAAMLDLWERAGGKRATCVRLKEDELDATARYTAKAPLRAPLRVASNNKEDFRATPPPPKLLNSRSISGLDLTWRTDGFWRGTTPEAIWKMLCKEWHGSEIDESDLLARAISRAEMGLPPKPLLLVDDEDMKSTPIPPAYIPGLDPVRDAWIFAEHMPTSPETAVGANDLAVRWGVDGDYMLRVFQSMPHAVRLNGELVDGRLISNAWYLDRSVVSRQT